MFIKETKLKPFGKVFSLLLTSLLVSLSWSIEACQKEFEVVKHGYEAQLQLNGDCSRGMYVLQVKLPDGRQQSVFQAYSAPVTGMWVAKVAGHSQPDVVMVQMLNEKLIKLLMYSWKDERFTNSWLAPLTAEQLQGYTGKDKVYVRWNELIRQVQVDQDGQLLWRRLTYNVADKRWVQETE